MKYFLIFFMAVFAFAQEPIINGTWSYTGHAGEALVYTDLSRIQLDPDYDAVTVWISVAIPGEDQITFQKWAFCDKGKKWALIESQVLAGKEGKEIDHNSFDPNWAMVKSGSVADHVRSKIRRFAAYIAKHPN